jgi:hypothetical protein
MVIKISKEIKLFLKCTYPKPSFLVPTQQAFLERTSKETRHDIEPKLCKIGINSCYVL